MEENPTAAKKPMNKTEILAALCETTGLTKQQVGGLFDELAALIRRNLTQEGPGVFAIPGLMQIKVVRKPATPERKGINPFTKEETVFKAKPAKRGQGRSPEGAQRHGAIDRRVISGPEVEAEPDQHDSPPRDGRQDNRRNGRTTNPSSAALDAATDLVRVPRGPLVLAGAGAELLLQANRPGGCCRHGGRSPNRQRDRGSLVACGESPSAVGERRFTTTSSSRSNRAIAAVSTHRLAIIPPT